MTDPDDRRSQARHAAQAAQATLPQGIQQPNFGLLAALIPEVQIPESFNAPRQFGMPTLPVAVTGNTGGQAASWRDMLSLLPPLQPPARRGRHRQMAGPRNIISGAHADPALNNVHRGQIALREQAENHRQAALQAQQEAEQARQMQVVLLQQLQQAEQERQRQLTQQLHLEMRHQWRAEHERELDPDLDPDNHDLDGLNDEDWQRLDDAIGQVWQPEQPDNHAAEIYGENRRFENQVRREMHNEDDIPAFPPRNPRDLPKARRPYTDPLPNQIHSLGPMGIVCSQCDALHWKFEKLSASSVRNPKFGTCCLQGQIQLPPLRAPPRYLNDMLCGVALQSKTFRQNIRQYNAAFAFTSLGVKIDHAITNAPGPYSFRIYGELHHHSGALLPEENQPE
jgi:hypothetical protein